MRRTRGFTLVEMLVALFALALLAIMSWRGLDGMMRSREITAARADEILALQTGLAQWAADLDAIVAFPPSRSLDWNGRVLRLTRSSSQAPSAGAHVVAWAQRDGKWLRWQSAPVTTRGDLEAAWEQAGQWGQNPSEALRQQEVAITPLAEWQLFYFRADAWTNPLSSDGDAPEAGEPVRGARRPGAPSTLPDGVRLVLQLPPGRALSGMLQRDWVRPTLGGSRS
jgi:general secretion pathway protein J